MTTPRVDWREATDRRDVVHRAVELLAGGELVVLPSECGDLLCASAACGAAVERLAGPATRTAGEPTTEGQAALLVKGPGEALDFAPGMGLLGRKFARRGWPGPLVLRFGPEATGDGLLGALPAAVSQTFDGAGAVRLRVVQHDAVAEILSLLPAPLVGRPLGPQRPEGGGVPDATASGEESPSPNRGGCVIMQGEGGGTSPSDADEPAANGTCPARNGPALFVDDGPARFPAGLSVVDVDGSRWRLLRVGALTETMVTRMAGEVVLFVCTGNTCRSPMAEAVCRRLLSDRLGCRDEELSDRGFVVLSAGIAAGHGAPASPEAVELMRERGCDLQNHASRPLTDRLLEGADRIFAMTDQHRRAILAARPELADRVRLLSPNGRDVPDPIGGGMRDYEECLRTIENHLRAMLDELAPDPTS